MQPVKTVKLGEIATVSPEGYQPKGESKYYVGLEHVQKDTGQILPDAREEPITAVKNRFYAGEILYGKLRPYLNKVALASREGVCSTDILVLRPSSVVEPRYLFHYMLSDGFVRDMSANVAGANLPRVSTKYILNYPVPLPDLDTQRHIAAVLDKADALRQKDRQLLSYYEQLPQAVFLEMFGDPVSNEKGWEVKRFGELGEARLGKMLDAKKQTGKHQFPYLGNSNVQWGRFNLTNLLQMDFDEKDQKEFSLKYGDLLICEGGEVGRAAIWREEMQNCFFQKAIHRVRLNPFVATPELLYRKIGCSGQK